MENTMKNVKVSISSNDDKKKKSVSYAKWGYIFLIPFFLVYAIFTLYPQISTFVYSFFDYYQDGFDFVGPNWYGFQNYAWMFTRSTIWKSLGNTAILWIIGAVPQFVIALLLAVLFTSTRLNLKFQGFFKSVFYLPNMIMASAFAILFFQLFTKAGPINKMFFGTDMTKYVDWIGQKDSSRVLIALINYLMWFGNTTILLMAGIQGIDESLFESARMDGASSTRVFFDITMPLLKPIFVYVFITSLIGGIQMYDVPRIMTGPNGTPNRSNLTIVMMLAEQTGAHNYGRAGAISVFLFLITFVLSMIIYKTTDKE